MSSPIPNALVLDHLVAHLPMAREGTDPRGAHQVRVATRRLGVWLVLGGHTILVDDLRWLRSAAAGVRDLDVLMTAELPDGWRAWLDERRASARTALVAAVDSPRVAGLVHALRVLPPASRRRARREARALVATAVRLGRAVEGRGATLDDIHALRRSLRRVRYALEWLGRPAEPLVAAQDDLGELNDAWVALRLLDAYGASERDLVAVRARIEGRIDDGCRRAKAVWSALRDGLLQEEV